MSVISIGSNRFPATSQLTEYYVKRRFATEEIYNKYIEDIVNLISVAVPEYQNYVISDEMREKLNQKVSILEARLEEVSSLYKLSDDLNYKNAEKEVAELNKIIQDTLAKIKEEVDNLKYKEFDYYLRQKLIEIYQTKSKEVVNILTNNRKILTKNGALVILGKDNFLYGIGNNFNGVLGSSDINQKSLKRLETASTVRDFILLEDRIFYITTEGSLFTNDDKNTAYIQINDGKTYEKFLNTFEKDNDSKNHTFFSLMTTSREVVVYNYPSEFYFISPTDSDDRVGAFWYGDEIYILGNKDYYWVYSIESGDIKKINPREESEITDMIGNYLPKIIPDFSILLNEFGSQYVLDETKNLFVRGSNKYGQLGIGLTDVTVDKFTRVEKFKNGVKSIVSTGDRAYLIASEKSYTYKNDNNDKYRNEEEESEDSMLWVTGRNEVNDRLIGIPTLQDLENLNKVLSEIDMDYFEDESLFITDEQQDEINNLLTVKANVNANFILAERKFNNNIIEWTKVYPDKDTDFLLSDIKSEIEEVLKTYSKLKSEIELGKSE